MNKSFMQKNLKFEQTPWGAIYKIKCIFFCYFCHFQALSAILLDKRDTNVQITESIIILAVVKSYFVTNFHHDVLLQAIFVTRETPKYLK